MPVEHRFVLADFTCPTPRGTPRLYEAGRSYPMPPAIAHAAAQRDLVAHHKPARWTPPSCLAFPVFLTAVEIEEAEAELLALDRHAVEVLEPVATH